MNRLFEPGVGYTLSEISRIAEYPTRTEMSYAVVWACNDAKHNQYNFIRYPFVDGNYFVLVSVNGEMPQLNPQEEQ